MKQADVERRFGVKHNMVVYYLSDLVGMALGISRETLGVDRHFVVEAKA
jgi:heterodisulfide reductase subunit B